MDDDDPTGKIEALRAAQQAESVRRTQAEDQLSENEERFRFFSDNIADVMAKLDEELRILQISPSVERLLGWPPEELVGKTILEMGLVAAPSAPQLESDLRSLREGKPVSAEIYQLVHKDGSTRWVEVSAYMAPTKRPKTLFIAVMHNITNRLRTEQQLRESEQKFRDIFVNASDYFSILDEQGIIIDTNNYDCLSPFGYRREELIGKQLTTFTASPEGSTQPVADWYANMLKTGQCPPLQVFEGLHRDGSKRMVECSVRLLPANGRAIQVLLIIRDITRQRQLQQQLIDTNLQLQKKIREQKRLQQKLKRYSTQLEQANTELSQCAAVISHDLCAPLRSIRFQSHILRKDLKSVPSGVDASAHLDLIEKAISESEIMASEILRLSEIGSKKTPAQHVDVGKLIGSILETAASDEHLEIVQPDHWPSVEVEPVLLRQVLQNLIENAIKFNTSERKRIEFSWRRRPGGRYEVSITDNGIGIPAKHHQDIFQPLKRLCQEPEIAGAGMGLAIAKKAVARMGGTVEVISQPGKGSTFSITIPGKKA